MGLRASDRLRFAAVFALCGAAVVPLLVMDAAWLDTKYLVARPPTLSPSTLSPLL